MVLNPFSTIVQVYSGGQFYWWKKPVYPEKITDLSKIYPLYAVALFINGENVAALYRQ
jgi:hypothetical protein